MPVPASPWCRWSRRSRAGFCSQLAATERARMPKKKMRLNYSTRTLAMTMKSLGGNQSTSNPLHPNSSSLNKFSFDKGLHAPTFKMVWQMVMAPPSIRLYLVASYTSIPRKAVFPHWACLQPNSGTRCPQTGPRCAC